MLELFDARHVRMDKRRFVLAGTEEFWHRKQATNFPQSWWCVPILPALLAPADPQ